MLRIEYNDPSLVLGDRTTDWGSGIYFLNGNLFTGVKTFHNKITQVLEAEYEYKDGVFDGRQAEYWSNGNLKEEYFQKYDYNIGAFKRWNEQGNLISYQEFDQFGNWVKTIL